MRTYLVTGGAGFIGSELVNQLYDLGEYEITVLDCMTEQIHGSDWHNSYLYNKIKDKCNFIYGDVRDYDVYDEKGQLVGYEKWNEYYKRWEYHAK